MSTERELAGKFKEAFETKNVDIISPHLTDDMTYEVLPSTSVAGIVDKLPKF